MVEYLNEVRKMEKSFDSFKVYYVPQLDNSGVEHLASVALLWGLTPQDMMVEKLIEKSLTIKSKHQATLSAYLMIVDGEEPNQADDWMQPIRTFLEN
jgi:hypothetical protein